jgi:hypothetical protein
MKRVIIIAAAAIALVAFTPHPGMISKDQAKVNRESGLYIFLESQPLADYEVLGMVKKTGLVWNGKAKEMRKILIRRTLKDYGNAEGIIFDDIDMDHATVIKFK